MKILRTLLTEQSESNVMDVQGFVIQPDFASAVKARPGSTPEVLVCPRYFVSIPARSTIVRSLAS